MKKSLSLSISKPCSEDWKNFTPVPSGGGFCSSCSKVVIDFTKMDKEEIIDFFKNKPTHTCGRFHPEQLKAYPEFRMPLQINSSMTLIKAGFFSLLFVLVGRQVSAQSIIGKTKTETVQHPRQQAEDAGRNTKSGRRVAGIVRSKEDNEPLPGVNIALKGTAEGMVADSDGRFAFSNLKPGDVLVFQFIGLVPQEYVVPEGMSTPIIEIWLEYDTMTLMGEVAVDQVYREKQSFFRRMFSFLR